MGGIRRRPAGGPDAALHREVAVISAGGTVCLGGRPAPAGRRQRAAAEHHPCQAAQRGARPVGRRP